MAKSVLQPVFITCFFFFFNFTFHYHSDADHGRASEDWLWQVHFAIIYNDLYFI